MATIYEIEIRPRAFKDLRGLSVQNQQRILEGIAKLSDNLAGDVKHLTDTTPEYRLRVGDYRALFEIEKREEEEDGEVKIVLVVVVYRVRSREDAYR